MRVGWAHADCSPGCQLGSDEYTWAFDGYNVSTSLSNFSQVTLIIILRPKIPTALKHWYLSKIRHNVTTQKNYTINNHRVARSVTDTTVISDI